MQEFVRSLGFFKANRNKRLKAFCTVKATNLSISLGTSSVGMPVINLRMILVLQSQEKLEVVAVGVCQNGFGTLRSVVKEDVLWRGSVSLTPSSSP